MLTTPFQTALLVEQGRFPAQIWADDLRRAEARCIVMGDAFIEVWMPQLAPEVRAAMKERFAFAEEAEGFKLYRAR